MKKFYDSGKEVHSADSDNAITNFIMGIFFLVLLIFENVFGNGQAFKTNCSSSIDTALFLKPGRVFICPTTSLYFLREMKTCNAVFASILMFTVLVYPTIAL